MIRAAGLKTALLTNNGYVRDDREKTLRIQDVSMFDVVVESCKVGIRKPHPDIYTVRTSRRPDSFCHD